MSDNGKRTAKTPSILILASFVIVVAGMKAASSLLVPFLLAVFNDENGFFLSSGIVFTIKA